MIYRVGQDKKTRQDKTEFLADEISFAGWHWMALDGTGWHSVGFPGSCQSIFTGVNRVLSSDSHPFIACCLLSAQTGYTLAPTVCSCTVPRVDLLPALKF